MIRRSMGVRIAFCYESIQIRIELFSVPLRGCRQLVCISLEMHLLCPSNKCFLFVSGVYYMPDQITVSLN